MPLFLVSFIAGIVTVAAPCVLPLLPVIVGGSLDSSMQTDKSRPYVIALSLAISVIIFTLLLKASTVLLGVPQEVWQIISGVIVLLFGFQLLFPILWERLSSSLRLQQTSNALLGSQPSKKGFYSYVVLGFALGPIFNSCSPTYALIVAVILPTSFTTGLLYLTAYSLGLSLTLLLIALIGVRITRRLGWIANPHGWFRKVIGILFILVGLAVLTGFDKKIQTYALDNGWYNGFVNFESRKNL